MSVEGGCRCRTIRYRASAAPSSSMVCHCETCRKIAGAPVVAWLTFAREHFAFIQGRPREHRSSLPVRRTFCGDCGTPLTYEHQDHPATLDVTTCTLDDPGRFPPTHHSWLGDDLHWVKFGDGLPGYPRSRNG